MGNSAPTTKLKVGAEYEVLGSPSLLTARSGKEVRLNRADILQYPGKRDGGDHFEILVQYPKSRRKWKDPSDLTNVGAQGKFWPAKEDGTADTRYLELYDEEFVDRR